MSNFSKSEQEIYDLRLEKIQYFLEHDKDSFPTEFPAASKIQEVINKHSDLSEAEHSGVEVQIHGRILNGRSFGKLSFYDLVDNSGRIQLLVDSKTLSDEENLFFSKYDSGDIVGVKGEVMKTKKGELSIKVSTSTILSKSLRTLPEKWHGLKDKETRFRQRYLDFIVNPDAKQTIEARSKVINSIRKFMHSKDFVEVETPILQPKAGGAIAKPFITHHNALDVDMFLRIAPELYLKRMIVGGFEKVFELGRVFRNEGIDQTHSPEFTMMESYEAYTNVDGVIKMVEEMCLTVFSELELNYEISFDEKKADFSFPWKKTSMFSLVSEHFNLNIGFDSDPNNIKEDLSRKNIEFSEDSNTIGLLVYDLFERYVEENIVNPTFVTDYPVEVSPFARNNKNSPNVTERFELFAFGSELANGFSELIDPIEQEARLKSQAQKKEQGDEEAHVEDMDYIEALEHALPPTGGLGFGIDRFVMMLTGNTSIREVVAFPHLKPEN
ncbi:MAG: lysine--tRNA ligase [Acidimicrobiia bacterium]|jgi:lysyl-tRNA synthetase class 2|nr:lysine--tRNA ligase [Acidimicrobiia bacterium]